jgi:hypothetical protein
MKFLITIFLVLSPFTDLDKIARINKAKKEAKEAFLSNNFQLANDTYKFLIDSLGVTEEEVLLDYAHTLYNLNDTTNAVSSYQELSESFSRNISSIAEQQLGQVMFDKKQYEPALDHYKNALRKNPSNQDARYNYELLKKIIQKQEEENKDQQNQDQDKKEQQEQDKENKEQNKDQENKDEQNKEQENQEQQQKDEQEKEDQEKKDQEKKDQEKKDGEKDDEQEKKEEQKDKEQQEGEKSEEKDKEQPQPTPSDKLEEMNISEEKAKMILEAMKNNEIQYIQQNRRKATKKKDNDKPDW